jgi:hypothetical protein
VGPYRLLVLLGSILWMLPSMGFMIHMVMEMLKLLVELHPWGMYNLHGTLVSKTSFLITLKHQHLLT